MQVKVEFAGEKKIFAHFNGYTVKSDQTEANGGQGAFPEPFDYLDTALALCAGHYVMSFCAQRDISTEGIEITQNSAKDSENRYQRTFRLDISLPASFPEKYIKAVKIAAGNCAVKRVIATGPNFELNVTRRN